MRAAVALLRCYHKHRSLTLSASRKTSRLGIGSVFCCAELGAGCVLMFSKKLLFARNNHAENQQDFGFVFIFVMLL